MSKEDTEYNRRARLALQEATIFHVALHDDPKFLRHVIQIAQERLKELQTRAKDKTA